MKVLAGVNANGTGKNPRNFGSYLFVGQGKKVRFAEDAWNFARPHYTDPLRSSFPTHQNTHLEAHSLHMPATLFAVDIAKASNARGSPYPCKSANADARAPATWDDTPSLSTGSVARPSPSEVVVGSTCTSKEHSLSPHPQF